MLSTSVEMTETLDSCIHRNDKINRKYRAWILRKLRMTETNRNNENSGFLIPRNDGKKQKQTGMTGTKGSLRNDKESTKHWILRKLKMIEFVGMIEMFALFYSLSPLTYYLLSCIVHLLSSLLLLFLFLFFVSFLFEGFMRVFFIQRVFYS